MSTDPQALFGRRQGELIMPSRVATRIGIRATIQRGGLTPEQLNTLQLTLDDNDLVDQVREEAGRRRIAQPGERDWAGFFEAFANFLKTIIPMLMDLIKNLGGIMPLVDAPPSDPPAA